MIRGVLIGLCIVGIIIGVCTMGGCAMLSPSRSKALSEIEQVKVMKEQNQILERIAVALENGAND